MTSRIAMPGLHSPAASFDQPFEMLAACHERVLRTLDLLQRLQAYLNEKGVDASVRQAARDVLRYFDVAAPLHHQDEELHVFPPLLQPGTDAATQAAVRQLQREHRAMEAGWAQARQPLQALADGDAVALLPADHALLQHFAQLNRQHLQREEAHIYPAAAAQIGPALQQAMGREMAARRGA